MSNNIISENDNSTVLTEYRPLEKQATSYQSEAELERQMIENLISQGYESLIVKSNDELYTNLKLQIEKLNRVSFSDEEWNRFLLEYLDAPNDGMIEKTRKIQENHIYDFIFDDGHLKNIKIIRKHGIGFCRIL